MESRGDVGMEADVEVREHDVAVGAEEDVFRLEVAVDEAEGVEILEGEEYLSGVEADCGKRKSVAGAAEEERMEVSTGAVIDEEARVVGCVETGVERGEEGVV